MEYRICWGAISNVMFRGTTNWEHWEEDDGNPEEVLTRPEEGNRPTNGIPGFNIAIEASGFDWWVETR